VWGGVRKACQTLLRQPPASPPFRSFFRQGDRRSLHSPAIKASLSCASFNRRQSSYPAYPAPTTDLPTLAKAHNPCEPWWASGFWMFSCYVGSRLGGGWGFYCTSRLACVWMYKFPRNVRLLPLMIISTRASYVILRQPSSVRLQ
jgi:hypothetical protein